MKESRWQKPDRKTDKFKIRIREKIEGLKEVNQV